MNPSPIQRFPRIAKGMALLFILRVCVGLSFLAFAAYGVYQMDLHILAVAGGILTLQALLMGILAVDVQYAPHRFSMLPAAGVAQSMRVLNP